MNIDFNKGDGLVPVIIQNAQTMQVLMLGYMNKEAFDQTIETKKVTFYSRSKQRLWMKGESSGNTLSVIDIKMDCDYDSLLIFVNPKGPTCHTGSTSCFKEETSKGFIYELEKTINDRINSNDSKSYTNELYQKGINKIAQKVGEEAVELVIEAKDSNDELFKNEAADLLYHLLILLKAKDQSFSSIERVLKSRSISNN
ncbi:MAG: bifunctional phosphoribosyl-AMP cyclohydrolase/phosphoribosyl-ATP diphosphatase HisIE [Crocinitomicaceae bacterium]